MCRVARRFGSPFLLKLLCPWVGARGGPTDSISCSLPPEQGYRVPIPGYILAAIILVGTAGAVALPAVRGTKYIVKKGISAVYPRRRGKRPAPATGARENATIVLARADQHLAKGAFAKAHAEYQNAMRSCTTNIRAYLGLATCASQLNRPKEARSAYQRALQLDPACAAADLGLGRLEYRLRRLDTAIRHANRVAQTDAANPAAYRLLSACHTARKEWDKAVEAASTAVALQPTNVEARLSLAAVYLQQGELTEAQREYDILLQQSYQCGEAHVGLARTLWKKGDRDGAVEHLEHVRSVFPDNIPITAQLAELLVARHERDRAISLYKRLVAEHAELQGTKRRLGDLLLRTGHFDEAYDILADIVSDHADPIAHTLLADLFLQKGLPSLALDHCRKALDQEPQLIAPHRLLARAYLRQGDVDQALRELKRILEASPNDMETLLTLGVAHEVAGQREAAESCMRSAATAYPESAVPLVRLGHLYLQRGEGRAALASYRDALQREPDQPVALNNVAILLLRQQGENPHAVKEAFALAKRAWKLFPGNANISDTLGWAYFHRRDYEKASGLLAYAAQRLPREPTIRYHLAAVLHAKGKLEQARGQLQAALDMSTDFQDAGRTKDLLADIERQVPRPGDVRR